MEYKYTGIILGKRDIGETDRIYSIYTSESGRIRVLAKGVRKANAKLAGFLENFNLGEISIAKSQGMGKITGFLVLNNFSGIKENLEAVQNVFESIKLFNKLVKEEEKDQRIFELLKGYLEAMDESATQKKLDKFEILSLGFGFKFLDELGYKIEANNCVGCGEKIKEGNNFFDAEQGGIFCEKCSPRLSGRIKISSNAVKIIRIFFQNSIKSIIKLSAEKKDLDNIKIIIGEFIKWTI